MTIAVPCAHASAAGRLRCRGSVLETASRPGSVPKPVRQTSREPQLVRGYGGLPSGGAGLSQPLSSGSNAAGEEGGVGVSVGSLPALARLLWACAWP